MGGQFIVAFACLFMTVASVPLPLATEDTVEQEAYSVIYDGPAGKHVQFGEPGKAVRGYYTQVCLICIYYLRDDSSIFV